MAADTYVTTLNLAFYSLYLERLRTILHFFCCGYLVKAFSEVVEGCLLQIAGSVLIVRKLIVTKSNVGFIC